MEVVKILSDVNTAPHTTDTSRMKRIAGIGNALTDMLVNMPTTAYSRSIRWRRLDESSTANRPPSRKPCGSSPLHALARRLGRVPTIRPRPLGYAFSSAKSDAPRALLPSERCTFGIEPIIFRGQERSGKCVSLISPDGERTMLTHLGAALELSAEEIEPTIFDGYDCLYIEDIWCRATN